MLSVREAKLDDSDILLRWRNDETTRRMSRDAAPISPEQHNTWFRVSLGKACRKILIVEKKSQTERHKIAMARFDRLKQEMAVEVSVNLNPEFRGRGLSKAVLSESIAYIAGIWDTRRFVAFIKPSNKVSAKAFTSCAFRFRCHEDGLDVYELVRS